MTELRWGAIAGWGIDFVRAAGEMSLLRRILFRLALNRHAAKEFSGFMNELNRNGFNTRFGYDLEEWGLHTPKLPFRWWRDRDVWPLRKAEES